MKISHLSRIAPRKTLSGLVLIPLVVLFACTKNGHAQLPIPPPGIINTLSGFQLYGSDEVAIDNAGNEYVSDVPDAVIWEVTTSGNALVVAGGGTGDGSGSPCTGIGGLATNAVISQVNGVAVDSAGNIYLSDGGCSAIWMVTASSGVLSRIAGNGRTGFQGDGGLATNAELSGPTGVTVDSNRNLYFLDSNLTRVRKITFATGVITTVAGTGSDGYTGDNGPATSAKLNNAGSVAVDYAGNLYIADYGNNRIRRVTASTGVISTVAGSGASGVSNCSDSGDGGPATSAKLCAPIGMAVDRAGNLYFGDPVNNVIRSVTQSNGLITTVAGNGTAGYSGDGGSATSAELNFPLGIALDTIGNIYIEDEGNNVIRVVGNVVPISVLDPLYQVTSIIYAAPGNKSSAGYTSTTTNGTTTTLGGSFSNSTSVMFSEGFMPLGSGGSFTEGFGVAEASTNATAFTETYTDATSAANQSNNSNANTVNHGQDEILIWLNPELTFTLSGSTPTTYSVGNQLAATGQVSPPDILEITASTMEDNGFGMSTVDPGYLNPQTLPSPTNGTQLALPGLAAVCKHVNIQEYQASACTLADQCGCTPSDFSDILAQDLLLNYNNMGTPYPGTVSPLEADVSGAAACVTPSASTDCRYVPVPASKGSTQIAFQTLQGPQCTTCNSNPNTFTQTDATTTTQTLGGSKSESVTAGFKANSAVFSLSVTDTLTWMQNQSTGTSMGSGNSQTVTFNSNTVKCVENITIYEDTVFHTFVFQEPTGNTTCP